VERAAWELPADFLVLATQNPREFEGTFPLPESQLDRFMLRIDVSYPGREAESEIIERYGGVGSAAQSALQSVTVIERTLLAEARAEAGRIHVAGPLSGYVLDLAQATREHPRLSLGLSTRGALSLIRAARVAAGLRGADFVTPDDVKRVAPWVLAHRIVLTPEAALEGATDAEVVTELLTTTPVPR
jgi:MoxR-like ATPase